MGVPTASPLSFPPVLTPLSVLFSRVRPLAVAPLGVLLELVGTR